MRRVRLFIAFAFLGLPLLIIAQDTQQKTTPDKKPDAAKRQPKVRTDAYGDPLPPHAIKRFGTVRLRHRDTINDLAFSPDGKVLASCSNDGTVRLWDARTGKELKRLDCTTVVNAIAFYPDGKTLASGDLEGNIIYWDTANGKKLRQIQANKKPINRLAISCRGVLAAASDNATLWDRRGNRLAVFGGKEKIYDVAFSDDGNLLVVASRAGYLHFCDVEKKMEVEKEKIAPPGAYAVGSIAISLDDKYLAYAGSDGLVLWDLAKRTKIREWKGLVQTPIAFTPDGKNMMAGFRNLTLTVWDPSKVKILRKFADHGSANRALAISPDGKVIATAGLPATSILLWDFATGKKRRLQDAPPREIVAIFPRNDLVMLRDGSRSYFQPLLSSKVRHVWNHSIRDSSGLGAWVAGLSPDSGIVAISSVRSRGELFDYKFDLFDVKTGKKIRTIPISQEIVYRIDFSPDNKFVAYWGLSTAVYSLKTGDCVYRCGGLMHGSGRMANHMAFSASGKYFAVSQGGALHLMTTANWKEHWQAIGTTIDQTGGIDHFAFDARDKLLAATDGKKVRIWDVDTGKERPSRITNPSPSAYIQFTPDGRSLVIGPYFGDPSPILVDLATGKTIRKFAYRKTAAKWMKGQFGIPAAFVVRLSLSRDGRMLCSWGIDHTTRLWEVITGKERFRLSGRNGPAELLPDGRTLFLSAWDNASAVPSFTDGTSLLWDTTGADAESLKTTRTAAELRHLWNDLKNPDAKAAYRAIWQIAAARKDSVAYVGRHLQPASKKKAKLVAKWVGDLDNDKFRIREKALEHLREAGPAVEPTIRLALAENLPLEQNLRLRKLLEKIAAQPLSGELLRQVRGVEALERIGNDEALQLLQRLASGPRGFRITEEARASLRRLQHKRKKRK